jgi:hypothetical protein
MMSTTPVDTNITVQDQLNIESAFRKYMDDIVQKANTITTVNNSNNDLCARSSAQNLYQVMNQYKSVEATVFWMEYQVSRNTNKRILFPQSLKTAIEKALRDTTITSEITTHVGVQSLAVANDIKMRYAIQLIAFVSRYIRMRTTNNNQ